MHSRSNSYVVMIISIMVVVIIMVVIFMVVIMTLRKIYCIGHNHPTVATVDDDKEDRGDDDEDETL